MPNVVYTCGAIVHGERLIVPYGFSDAGIAVAHLPLADLIEALLAGAPESTNLDVPHARP